MTALHQITLPLFDNSGTSLATAHDAFRAVALTFAGGYTEQAPARGHWIDKGHAYHEDVQSYVIACAWPEWRLIVARAWSLFPDQLALFTAHLGEADILEQPQTKPVPMLRRPCYGDLDGRHDESIYS